ncbi:MAG: hypothetical protein JO292_07695 [Betaproteobacteria bacterium]|nr:hypothetical protein [Betaproteobacteria bacterium]MBV9361260.1 hypothetical protein [Betaproteobacteria bacterium]
MYPPPSPEIKGKLLQIEEQLQLAIQDFPERIAVDRLKFALALAKFVRHQIDLDATVEQSIPESRGPRPRPQQ